MMTLHKSPGTQAEISLASRDSCSLCIDGQGRGGEKGGGGVDGGLLLSLHFLISSGEMCMVGRERGTG